MRKPSIESLRIFLAEQSVLAFSYPAVGATAGELPASYVVDRTRIELGAGEGVFHSATCALRSWRHFQLGWVEAWPADAPLESGQVVAIMGRALGLWWLNACRIVYTVNESAPTSEPISKFGFAYGTLPGHVESGEELFQIEWDHATDRVWYEITAFSRPNHVLARLGYPFVRPKQKRFGRDSAAALFRAVNVDSPLPQVIQVTV